MFVAGILAGLGAALLHHRNTTSTARKLAEDTKRGIDDAQRTLRDATDTGEHIADTALDISAAARSLADNNARIDDILATVREHQKE